MDVNQMFQENIDLKKRVRYLENIINMLPGHIYWQDRNNVFLGCNYEQAKSVGATSSEDIIGTTPYDYLPKAQADEIIKINTEVIKYGEVRLVEEQAIFEDGIVRVFLSHKMPLHNDNNEITGVLGVSIDITKQKELEKELMAAKESISSTLESIIATVPGNIYWKDRDGRYLGCNKEFANMIGLTSPVEIIGKSDRDLFLEGLGEERLESIIDLDQLVITSGEEKNIEEVGVDKEGKIAYYITRKSPLRDINGEIIGLIGSSLNISKQKEAEITKNNFLMNMSHDLITPFSGILSMSEYLTLTEADSTRKALLQDVKSAAKRLLNTLKDILELAKVGNMPAKYTQFDIKELIEEIRELVLPQIKSKGLSMLINCPNLIIQSDRLKLSRILLNLVGNAIKFTAAGCITIHVTASPKLTISIEDTGIGIPKDKLETIFDKFTKLKHSNTEQNYTGTGLGLYICKQFANEIGSEITVESELNSGSKFTLLF